MPSTSRKRRYTARHRRSLKTSSNVTYSFPKLCSRGAFLKPSIWKRRSEGAAMEHALHTLMPSTYCRRRYTARHRWSLEASSNDIYSSQTLCSRCAFLNPSIWKKRSQGAVMEHAVHTLMPSTSCRRRSTARQQRSQPHK